MKTISLLSRLFDGNYTTDGDSITQEQVSYIKGSEKILAQISNFSVTVTSTSTNNISISVIYGLNDHYAGGTAYVANGSTITVPSDLIYDSIYIRIKNDNGSTMTLASITSCNITYNDEGIIKLFWSLNNDDEFIMNYAPELIEKSMLRPYPYALWQFDSTGEKNEELGISSYLPYNDFLVPLLSPYQPPSAIDFIYSSHHISKIIYNSNQISKVIFNSPPPDEE